LISDDVLRGNDRRCEPHSGLHGSLFLVFEGNSFADAAIAVEKECNALFFEGERESQTRITAEFEEGFHEPIDIFH
jgi:hypothetical protein